MDLIAVYPQMVLGGNIKHYNSCSTSCDAQCASAEELCTVLPDLVEISSRVSLADLLIMNMWFTVSEASALHVCGMMETTLVQSNVQHRPENTLCSRSELDETCL